MMFATRLYDCFKERRQGSVVGYCYCWLYILYKVNEMLIESNRGSANLNINGLYKWFKIIVKEVVNESRVISYTMLLYLYDSKLRKYI